MNASGLKGLSRLIPFMGLGERITEAIEGSGKSKAQIARECNVTGGAVTQWANAKSLKAETALALEQATGYRAYWLMHGRGSKRAADQLWPFQKVELSRVLSLSTEDRAFVEGKLEAALERLETPAPTPAETDVTHPSRYPDPREAKKVRQSAALPPIGGDGGNEGFGSNQRPARKKGRRSA